MANYQIIDPWNFGSKHTYSTAVKKGNLLFISAMTSVDPKTGKLVGEDIITRFIFQKMEEVLKAAGASFYDVVKAVDYLITTKNYKETANICREYFKNRFPAVNGIVVKKLLRKNALIEIDAIGVLGD